MAGHANLAYGTWEDAEALIGETLATWDGADPVSRADIRRKLEVLALDCPLHYDEEAAHAHGHPDVVSPVSMYRTWATRPYWEPGDGMPGPEPMLTPVAVTLVPAPGDSMFATRLRSEYLQPVYPGDRLSASAVLESITPKRLRVGEGAFITIVTTWTNQRGEVVGRDYMSVFRYQNEDER